MPIKQLQLMCTKCDALMPHNLDRANHIVHGLLTLFTAGLYLPIWIIVAMGDNSPAVCVKCGSKHGARATVAAQLKPVRTTTSPFEKIMAVVLIAAGAALVVGAVIYQLVYQ